MKRIVGYTKFYEAYNKGMVKVESNVTDISFSYLFQSPTVFGVQPYFSLGGGIIVFSPIAGTIDRFELADATKSLPSQLLPEFAFNFGLNYPIFSRLGVRGGLRGLKYKTPDFHQFSSIPKRCEQPWNQTSACITAFEPESAMAILITVLDLEREPIEFSETVPAGAIDYGSGIRQIDGMPVSGRADLITEHRGASQYDPGHPFARRLPGQF